MTNKSVLERNQRNAQASTGPKSTEGKRRSSQNALRHGLSSIDALNGLQEGAADLAAAMAEVAGGNDMTRFQDLAMAQLTLKRVREVHQEQTRMLLEDLHRLIDARLSGGEGVQLSAAFEDLLDCYVVECHRLRRYEDRALGQRRKLMRAAARSC